MTWLDQNRNFIFIVLLVSTIGGIGGFYLLRQPIQADIEILPAEATVTITPPPPPTSTPGRVRVYVTGAVVKSDVYILPEGSIIKDAIAAAGGLTPDADREGINQALELKDQQQIHVPRQNEENPPPVQGGETPLQEEGSGGAAPAGGGLIDINTASLDQLVTLPGIGPAIGQRIIDYRENAGQFQSIEAITEVSGIGEATFAKIKDRITVK